jgi:Pentapeptide repeats (9 copies)
MCGSTCAPFNGLARFDEATLPDGTNFIEAEFNGQAFFHDARFTRHAWFDEAVFRHQARFDRVHRWVRAGAGTTRQRGGG